MSLEVEATYEDGVLKLDKPLPLHEHERVTVEIKSNVSLSRRLAGSIRWTGTPEDLRRIAEDPEEMIEFLGESRADIDAGRTKPVLEALEELAEKHKLKSK
jgi:predicted DNA-binding antitoxin AbrB/MazE fold protein